VLDLVPDRKLKTATTLSKTLMPVQLAFVTPVAMSRWPAFMSATKQCLPQTDIVHDRFHISWHHGEAVDAARNQQHRRLMQARASPLNGGKWVWHKNYPDRRRAEAVTFWILDQLNFKTSRTWTIMKRLSQFRSYS
jgi:transposase